jgi:hypothetical protein
MLGILLEIADIMYCSHIVEEKRKSFCKNLATKSRTEFMTTNDCLSVIQANQEKIYRYGVSINVAFEFLYLPCIKSNFQILMRLSLKIRKPKNIEFSGRDLSPKN